MCSAHVKRCADRREKHSYRQALSFCAATSSPKTACPLLPSGTYKIGAYVCALHCVPYLFRWVRISRLSARDWSFLSLHWSMKFKNHFISHHKIFNFNVYCVHVYDSIMSCLWLFFIPPPPMKSSSVMGHGYFDNIWVNIAEIWQYIIHELKYPRFTRSKHPSPTDLVQSNKEDN